jgi:HD superfamily phosphohydrolase/serine/threonine protein kinase
MKNGTQTPGSNPQSGLPLEEVKPPDFRKLLEAPLVPEPLPSNFSVQEEGPHLEALWDKFSTFRQYDFQAFVHAGGSGMVFKAVRKNTGTVQALKVVRAKLMKRASLPEGAAASLSPVSPRELRALEKLSHPNVVHLYEAIGEGDSVVAIGTTYVENPQALDSYLKTTLARIPRNVRAFSPRRLDGACDFLVARSLDIANALAHMHSAGIYHFDVKPANVLVSAKRVAMLTDLGACIHSEDVQKAEKIRVNFTWTYAHPDLTSMINKPESISGGGLKASADLAIKESLQKYDLFAFGRMLQEALAILEEEFGERAHAAYGFRYLHLIASLLMDGRNAPAPEGARVVIRDGKRFASDVALDYPSTLFGLHRISSAEELVERLRRYSREYSWYAQIPELDPWQPNLVNTGVGDPAPFTERVASVLGHPVVRRLKSEAQLGWIREVFPGATHNRWSHTIGVFASLVRYYNALLADPETPTLRILLNADDLSHAMIGALLHDIGQVSFGHDLEAACPFLYNHEDIVTNLLDEKGFGQPTLRQTLERSWPEVDPGRVLGILRKKTVSRPIDGIAQDIVDGPIDADKLDYVRRDSIGCGVPYGLGIDSLRFVQALSVAARSENKSCRLLLAYKAKGSAAIEGVLLARYQMYGAVYWHHTFRCIQSMFSHATALTFEPLRTGRHKLRNTLVSAELVSELLYHWVVCGKSTPLVRAELGKSGKNLPTEFNDEPPPTMAGERAIEFVWKFADDKLRRLLERVARRDLYKRIFEIKVSDLGDKGDYSALRNELEAAKRPSIASAIEERFLNAIYKAMAEKGPRDTATENEARTRYQELSRREVPRVVIDFPTRGVPEEDNVPPELSDPARKYTAGRTGTPSAGGKVFHVVRNLQTQKATLRVFAADELHELVVRYLDPATVEACITEVIPRVRLAR